MQQPDWRPATFALGPDAEGHETFLTRSAQGPAEGWRIFSTKHNPREESVGLLTHDQIQRLAHIVYLRKAIPFT